jgi:hypothetical protein
MVVLALLFLSAPAAEAQRGLGSLYAGIAYSNPDLDFRYSAPPGMHDRTDSGKSQIQARASENHTNRAMELLLAMSSGSSNSDSEWRSLAVEAYPRELVADLDDSSAEAKISALVAGVSGSSGTPRFVVLSDQKFAVYVFATQEKSARKGAVVWTTIRKGKLLSFAFVANSPEQLKALAESMKTVQFF